MSVVVIIILVALLCIIAMFAMMNVPKDSPDRQNGAGDDERIIGKEDSKDKEEDK